MGSPASGLPIFLLKRKLGTDKKLPMDNFNQSEDLNSIPHYHFMQLRIIIHADLVPLFFRLLSQGFVITVQAGCSVKDLLCRQLGIQEEYLNERIQTIFLNGKAVDDVDSSIVQNESTLALSGPMPGLVGAILRRGGFYAAMRSQISQADISSPTHPDQGKVILKLFNLVAKELGPGFLQQGVWLKGKHLHDFISENFDYLKKECKSLKLDQQIIDISKLSNTDFTNKSVFLKIMTPEGA
jgi:hypothetical protein